MSSFLIFVARYRILRVIFLILLQPLVAIQVLRGRTSIASNFPSSNNSSQMSQWFQAMWFLLVSSLPFSLSSSSANFYDFSFDDFKDNEPVQRKRKHHRRHRDHTRNKLDGIVDDEASWSSTTFEDYVSPPSTPLRQITPSSTLQRNNSGLPHKLSSVKTVSPGPSTASVSSVTTAINSISTNSTTLTSLLPTTPIHSRTNSLPADQHPHSLHYHHMNGNGHLENFYPPSPTSPKLSKRKNRNSLPSVPPPPYSAEPTSFPQPIPGTYPSKTFTPTIPYRHHRRSDSASSNSTNASSTWSAWSTASNLPSIAPFSVLRTSSARFDVLCPEWAYRPRYFELPNGIRVTYIDERPGKSTMTSGKRSLTHSASDISAGSLEDAAKFNPANPRGTIVCLHGALTWSYLYRHLIPPLLTANYRVLCLDFPGFGKSDKPTDPADYTLELQVETLKFFLSEVIGIDDPAGPEITLIAFNVAGIVVGHALKDLPEQSLPTKITNLILLSPSSITPTHPPASVSQRHTLGPSTDARQRLLMIAQLIQTTPLGWLPSISSTIYSGTFDETMNKRSKDLIGYDAPFPTREYSVGALYMLQSMVRGAWWDLLGASWLQNIPGFRNAWIDWERKKRDGELAWEGIREWLVREDSGGWGSSVEGYGFVEERLDKKRKVLVICGAEDKLGGGRIGAIVAEGLGEGLAEDIVEVTVVEGAGHFLLEDHPAKVAKIIKKWLNDI